MHPMHDLEYDLLTIDRDFENLTPNQFRERIRAAATKSHDYLPPDSIGLAAENEPAGSVEREIRNARGAIAMAIAKQDAKA